MFDAKIRPYIDPILNRVGIYVAACGITANQVTMMGAVLGVAAGIAIAMQAYVTALVLIAGSRLLDGLDGAIARANRPTDFGGYLDIVADFVFYLAIPVGFGFAHPDNLVYALVLVASFTLTGVSFLTFATLAAKNDMETSYHGQKSFFYSTGIAEGTETILIFVLMCLIPAHFSLLAVFYSVLCAITVLQRSVLAYRIFAANSGDKIDQ